MPIDVKTGFMWYPLGVLRTEAKERISNREIIMN